MTLMNFETGRRGIKSSPRSASFPRTRPLYMSMPQSSHVPPTDLSLYADLPAWSLDYSVTGQNENAGTSPVAFAPAGMQFNPSPFYGPMVPEASVSYNLAVPLGQSSVHSTAPATQGPISAAARSSASQDPSCPPTLPLPRRIRVPQTILAAQTGRPSYSVEFKVRGSHGVRVRDVLKDRARLDSSEERVFESTGARQFRLVIAWPGYPQSGTYIPVQDRSGFITRGRLAMLISVHLSRFVERASRKRPMQGDAQWEINRRGIRLEHIWLISVAPARHNIWLAELEIQV